MKKIIFFKTFHWYKTRWENDAHLSRRKRNPSYAIFSRHRANPTAYLYKIKRFSVKLEITKTFELAVASLTDLIEALNRWHYFQLLQSFPEIILVWWWDGKGELAGWWEGCLGKQDWVPALLSQVSSIKKLYMKCATQYSTWQNIPLKNFPTRKHSTW